MRTNFKTIRTLLLIMWVVILSFQGAGTLQAQSIKKFNKYLEKAEDKFEKNDYNKAIKFTKKLESKSKKKLGPENQFVAVAKLKRAKYLWAKGQFKEFDQYIQDGIALSQKVNGENSIGHALILLDAANNYMHYGNYAKAEKYLTQSSEYFKESSQADKAFITDIELKFAEIYIAQGFYNKALALIEEKEPFYLKRGLPTVKEIDPKSGKEKEKKLSKDELELRYKDIARLITLKSRALSKKGKFDSSDSAFVYGENWIHDKLGKRSKELARHLYYFAEMLEENGGGEFANDYFKTAYISSSVALGEIHPFTIQAMEGLVINSVNIANHSRATGFYKDLEYVLKKNFEKSSSHFVRLATISFESNLKKGEIKKTENAAAKVMSDKNLLPKDHPINIDLYKVLVRVANAQNVYPNAENYLNEIVKIKSTLYGDSSVEVGFSKIDLANHYIDYTDRFKEAAAIYDEEYFGKIENEITFGHIKYVEVLNHLAAAYESNDEYAKASQILDQALLATRKKYDNKDIDFGKELNRIAELQIKIGEYEKAELNLKEALSILEEYDDNNNVIYYIKALENNAKLQTIKGFFDVSEESIEQAQKLLKKAVPSPDYNPVTASQELAGVYLQLGEYSEAEEILIDAIDTNEDYYGEESQKLIKPLVDYGRLRLIKGDYSEAEKIARRALKIAESIYGESSTKATPATILLGELYENIGDYDKSEEFYNRSITTLEKQFGRKHVDVATTISKLALVKFYNDEEPEIIEDLLFEAKDIIGKRFSVLSPIYADLLKDLATFYIDQNKLADAFSFLEQSQKIWQNKAGKRNNIKAADIHILRGDIYYKQRKYNDAEDEYGESQKLNERFFSDNHPEYVKATSRLSKVYYMQGNRKKAKEYIEEVLENYSHFIDEFFPALSEREKTKYWNTIRGDYDYFNTMALTMHDRYPELIEEVYDNTIKTKALLLSSSIKMRERILNSTDSLLRQQYFSWIDMKEDLTQAISMSPAQLDKEGINLNELARNVELAEKELSQKSEYFSQGFEKEDISWKQIQKTLDPNEVAIEMVRFRYFDHILTDSVVYMMLILKNDKQSEPSFIVLNDGKNLESKFFNNYRNSIKYRIDDRYSYQKYWKPIEEKVGTSATIYLSADGVYNQINLETIQTGDEDYLIDHSNIVLVSNTKDLYLNKVKTRQVQEDKTALLFGDPEFYLASKEEYKPYFQSGRPEVNALPGTKKEVEELETLLEENGWVINDYLNQQASEEEVKVINSPKVFHIATHGFFTEEEDKKELDLGVEKPSEANSPLLRTGLMMKGAGDLLVKTEYNYNIEPGILTAYEAMNLNLDKTDLVVLSACETGRGEIQAGEGVFGLQRSFLVAGARTLIMSLFKVDDEATQKLMVAFYKKWITTGNKRESFIQAKKEIRNEYKDPIYWGAFVMIGLE